MSNQTNREPSATLIARSEVGIDDAPKTQNLIKQQNKNENNSDGSIRKIMKLMQMKLYFISSIIDLKIFNQYFLN